MVKNNSIIKKKLTIYNTQIESVFQCLVFFLLRKTFSIKYYLIAWNHGKQNKNKKYVLMFYRNNIFITPIHYLSILSPYSGQIAKNINI